MDNDEDKPEVGEEDIAAKLAAAEAEASENKDAYLRAKAEVENVRRRSQQDVEKAHKYSIERFAKELLTIVDSFESGLAVKDQDAASLLEGMDLTYKMMLSMLEKFSITQINPVGEVFDPAKHEAISMQPTDDSSPNTILKVVQAGFMQHDRVLRNAKVIIAVKTEEKA